MKTITFLLLLTCGLLSCSKTITCTDPPINFAFISFAPGDIDTLVLRKFQPGNNFQQLIDTFNVFNDVNAGINNTSNDTVFMFFRDPRNEMKPGFDWQVYIPSTNRTIYISNILVENKTEKCAALSDDCACHNEILGIRLNNQKGVFRSYPVYYLFIR